MESRTQISTPSVSLPKGGGALKGIGESFRPNTFSGTGDLSFPVYTSPCRDFAPQLNLDYSSGSGNGNYGIGFSIELPSVYRQTDKGIPSYDEKDTFIYFSEGHLTPKLIERDGRWIVDEKTRVGKEGDTWIVRAYVPRVEGALSQIQQWINSDTGESHWRTVSRENVTSIFGRTEGARVADPDNPARIFEWLIEETGDAKGNKIVYTYKQENDANVAPAIYEADRVSTAKRYLHSIRYGIYYPDGTSQPEAYAFEVIFDYGEYDIDDLERPGSDPYRPVGEWKQRRDPFSTYRSGFEMRTYRLCRNVLMFHHLSRELGTLPCLVRATRLTYDGTPALSFLTSATQTGYRRNDDDSYEVQSLPPVEFTYSQFAPPAAPVFRRLHVEGLEAPPGYLSSSGFQLLDLNGEGLPGLLFSDETTTLYYEPLGEGEYVAPAVPDNFPNTSNLERPSLALYDLDGDGQLELVVNALQLNGFYKHRADGSWEEFRPFRAAPTGLLAPQAESVDLEGNGKADLLFVKGQSLLVYPSEGEKGYGAPRLIRKATGFPNSVDDQKVVVAFADIFGDGLSHRVKVSDGQVEVWPDLGYGRFGKKVMLAGAPRFERGFSAARIYFADVDGSGTADLVFAYTDRVEVYLNRSGNSFAAPRVIQLPAPLTALDQLSFADIRGHGSTALVLTRMTPEVRHWYYEFGGENEWAGEVELKLSLKPYLLTRIDNNMGLTTEIKYGSSTRFYLEDKRAGRAWATRLPFPVQVVEKVITTEHVTGLRVTNLFKYHDGFYDPVERSFNGFGFVESWDTETFEAFSDNVPPAGGLDAELYVPPVHTRTWYHTGAFIGEKVISRQYEQEYFAGDPEEYRMPDSHFDAAILSAGAETLRQAYGALKGNVLRAEVYADDADQPALAANPYTVTENNYQVQLLQPLDGQKHASFYVRERESITYDYERNPADPRIQHSFLLAQTLFDPLPADDYSERRCIVYYGRRPSNNPDVYIYPEQSALKARVEVQRLSRTTEDFRIIGAPYEARGFVIGGLSLQGASYFSFDAIKGQVDEALQNQIPYGVDFDAGQLQARLNSWRQSYYWNPEQSDALPLGQISERALLHHVGRAVFSYSWLQQTYGDKVNAQLLELDAGYFNDGAGYWWNRGLVQSYFDPQHPERFYLPSLTENPYVEVISPPYAEGLFARIGVAYDEPYYFTPVAVSTHVDADTTLITTAEVDYYVLAPWQTTDANGVVRQVLFDPLGMVIATSVFKEADDIRPRQGDGNLRDYVVRAGASFDSVLGDRPFYLQEAASFFFYDLFAWKDGRAGGLRQPASYVSLVRQDYVSDPQPELPIQARVGYSSGLGEVVEEKLEAEPGLSIIMDEQGRLARTAAGRPVSAFATERWIVSGRTVYNNKGEPAQQYLPYYSNVPFYEEQQQIVDEGLVPPPTVTTYDPLLRVIRVDTPKGFFSKVEFTPWEEEHYDEDDTVKDAPFYIQFFLDYPPDPTQAEKDEKDALDKAAKFYRTPSTVVFDNAGRTLRTIQNNLGDVPPDTFTEIVQGSPVTSEELWNELKTQGYLATDTAGTWVTGKFQPYAPGFALQLGPPYAQFADAVTAYLLPNTLTTFLRVDDEGRTLETIDPRLYYANVRDGSSCYNFTNSYPMETETPSFTDSADAGPRWVLDNIYGSGVVSWDGRGQQVNRTFDWAQRPLTTVVTDATGATMTTEVITYGEGQPDARENNLRGEIYQYQDQAGVLLNKQYSLEGQVMLATRQLREDYKTEVNWAADVPLEDKIYQTSYQYDALLRVTSEVTDDGSNYQPLYFISGRLQSIQVTDAAGAVQPYVTNVNYNANNQRASVTYGNAVVQNFTYEWTTNRLLALMSTRPGMNNKGQPREAVVQNVNYTYDPVGNVTLMRDKTQQTVFCNNQQVEAVGDYTYDALYRLARATGRQHPGITANTHVNGFEQSIFAFLCPPNDQTKMELYTEVYDYDDSNNLITTRHTAVSSSFRRDNPVEPCANRLAGMEYDGNGNSLQLSLNNTVGLDWDYRNNLARTTLIEREDGIDDSDYFVYDYRGRRIRKVVERYAHGGTVTEIEEYIYLGSYQVKRLKKLNGIGPVTILERQTLCVMDEVTRVAITHYWPIDLLGREKHAGERQIRYQLDNYLGSISVELDQSDASIISYEEYFPYGGTSVIAGDDQSEVALKLYRYSGQECDNNTGLYYYGARYYVTWMGRWLSTDPLGPVDGLNLYEFAGGNPVTYLDEQGYVKGKGKKTPEEKKERVFFKREGVKKVKSGAGRSNNQNFPLTQVKVKDYMSSSGRAWGKVEVQFFDEVAAQGYAGLKESGTDMCHVTSASTMKEVLAETLNQRDEFNAEKTQIILDAVVDTISSDEEADREKYAALTRRMIDTETPLDDAITIANTILTRINRSSRNLRPAPKGPNRAIKNRKDTFLLYEGGRWYEERRSKGVNQRWVAAQVMLKMTPDTPVTRMQGGVKYIQSSSVHHQAQHAFVPDPSRSMSM